MKKLISFAFVIMATVLLLCACSHTEAVEMANCTECHAEHPKEYLIRAFSEYRVCPSCAERQISTYKNQRESVSDSVENYGEYISDDDDYMVVEKSECNWCGNYAPADLYDENGERICIDCITEALQNDKVARAIRNYVEYG